MFYYLMFNILQVSYYWDTRLQFLCTHSAKYYKKMQKPPVYFLVGQINISKKTPHIKEHHKTSNNTQEKHRYPNNMVKIICF
jgi:hypothetical protein